MPKPRTVALLALATATFFAGCAEEQIGPFEPRKLGQAQRTAAIDQSTADLKQLPTTYKSWEPTGSGRNRRNAALLNGYPAARAPTGNEPRRRLALADVIRRTASNNLDVRAAGFGPGIESARIVEAQARFDPTFFANTTAEITNRQTGGSSFTDPRTIGTTQQSTSILDRTRQTVFTGQSGVRQILETGAQVEASYQLRQTDGNPNNFVLDPFREAELVLQITQPLLRDFGAQVNRARIDIAKNNAQISFFDFRTALETAVDEIEQVYWALADAQRQVTIQEERVRGAEDTADLVSKRLDVDQSRLQLNQAAAEAESRRAALTAARARVLDLSDQLKQRMNDPEFPVSSPLIIETDTSPLDRPVVFDVEDLIDTALLHRPEIAQQQLRIDNATVTLGAAKNNLLPQLNAQARYNPQGLGPGFDDAIDSQGEFNKNSYSVGLQFEIPIGNREARSIYRRSLLTRMQSITQYQSLVDSIARDVLERHRATITQWDNLRQFRAARFAREQALKAIAAQEAAAEPLTPNFIDLKLRQQDFLAQAQLDESRALAAYNVALSQLERAKGTILSYNNITMNERGVRRQLSK